MLMHSPQGRLQGLRPGTLWGMLHSLTRTGTRTPGTLRQGQPFMGMGYKARRYVWLTRSTPLNWEALRLPSEQARICVCSCDP